ncbi:MAG: hypothetical protein K0S18_136 [Anaerocolumna sp.]|jgi:hypothetical protein|nr:hypothetical protein [Anaerocolumna sp.]
MEFKKEDLDKKACDTIYGCTIKITWRQFIKAWTKLIYKDCILTNEEIEGWTDDQYNREVSFIYGVYKESKKRRKYA